MNPAPGGRIVIDTGGAAADFPIAVAGQPPRTSIIKREDL
jgi:hypothetical protein